MPIKLNVGLAQTVGDASNGSHGANISLEIELDSSLVNEPTKLKDRIKQLFALVRTSLTDELKGESTTNSQTDAKPIQPATNGKAHNGRSNGARLATPPQVKKIQSLIEEQKLDLDTVLRERCQVQRLEDLSVRQASDLIDVLKVPLHPQSA